MSLQTLFYPKSVALIGASTHEGSVGNEIAKNLVKQGYTGRLYLVNPKGGEVYGKKLIKNLNEIKKPLDLAIIAIPAAFVLQEVKELIKLQVKAVIVISAGFKEVGKSAEERELAHLCREHNIALIGPNCLGLLNPEVKLNASFAPLMPSMGQIAFVSQSGAMCASVLDFARKRQLGFSKFISLGNKALVDEAQILAYLYNDKKTRIIGLYVEELAQIEELRKVAFKITHGKSHKPIIIIKAGRTAAGQKAAMSHTGSLGGSDDAYEALFTQTGIIRASNVEELFDLMEVFARNHDLKNNRVAVITNAGGPGVLTADALIQAGLQLAELQADSQAKLKAVLPPAASVKNPIDILGDAPADRYEVALKVALADPGVDAVQIILTPQSMTEVKKTAQAIVKLTGKTHKPLVVTFMGEELVQPGLDILAHHNIATSHFPEPAANALAALSNFHNWLKPRKSRPESFDNIHPERVRSIIAKAYQAGRETLDLSESFSVLKAYGFPVVKRFVVTNHSDAEAVAKKITTKAVLKIVSPDISHKTEVGGVVLNIEPHDIPREYAKLIRHIHHVKPSAHLEGVEVMPMLTAKGVEIIVGVTTDPQLGKQVLVGLGGIYTEVFQDVSWGLAPLTSDDIHRMISHLKTVKLLKGVRGQQPLAVTVIEECLGRLSQLVTDFPEIQELDINPLMIAESKKDSKVVDARILLAK